MDGKMLARLGAIIFVAIAITATVIEMTREYEPAQPRPAPALQAPADPPRQSLRHCQQLGEAGRRCPPLRIRTGDSEPWAAPASSTTFWVFSPVTSTAASACLAARSPSSPPP
ncbi:putative entry exclusion protein TrbK-alt [Shinella sp.]|uniref:putative entry exclusion protein TrbK-alt n=1 Tax=Shinella sp. TaxID=1870904 RepID=UPI0039181920